MVVKTSDAYADTLGEAKKNLAQELNKSLWQDMGRVTAIGAGVGAGARGLQGLWNLVRRNVSGPAVGPNSPLTLDIPDTREDEEEEKFAGFFVDRALGFLSGDYASTLAGHPLSTPTKVLGAGAGAIGGWKLLDWIMDRRRKSEMQAEAAKAEEEYEQALLGQHKQGSLGHDLDLLFDETEKQGTVGDFMGGAAGIYLTGAGLGALLTGKITHDIARKRQRQSLLTKARRKHMRQSRSLRPAAIYVNPLPDRNSLKTAPDEDEMDGEPLDKVASGADKIPGGLADGKPDNAFPEEKTEQGEAVEMEHTSDEEVAEEIAKDHLTEDPDYYDKLKTIEKASARASRVLARLAKT